MLLVDGQAKTIHRGSTQGDVRQAFAATPISGLPMGPHVLRVERAGFMPIEHLVVVPGGDTTTVRVTLRPTAETHAAYVQRANAYRGWSVALLSAGIAAALAGGALALTRQLSLPEARRYLDEERREQEVPMNGGECDPSLPLSEAMAGACDSRLQAAYDAVWIREQIRLIGIIGVGAGPGGRRHRHLPAGQRRRSAQVRRARDRAGQPGPAALGARLGRPIGRRLPPGPALLSAR